MAVTCAVLWGLTVSPCKVVFPKLSHFFLDHSPHQRFTDHEARPYPPPGPLPEPALFFPLSSSPLFPQPRRSQVLKSSSEKEKYNINTF